MDPDDIYHDVEDIEHWRADFGSWQLHGYLDTLSEAKRTYYLRTLRSTHHPRYDPAALCRPQTQRQPSTNHRKQR